MAMLSDNNSHNLIIVYLDGSSRTRIAAERLDGRCVQSGARVRPEEHLVVDRQVALDPAADSRVLVRAVGAARQTVLLVVHDVIPAAKQVSCLVIR